MPEINENKSEGELEVGEILCNDDETIFELLPRKKKFKSTKSGFFREMLKEIKDLSYLIDNDDAFSEAFEHLFCIRKILQPSVPTERGLSLEHSKKGSKRKTFPLYRCPDVKRRHILLAYMGRCRKRKEI